MALKDISPTTIANILALIATANDFAYSVLDNNKFYRSIPVGITKAVNPQPNGAKSALKSWFDSNIKSGVPAAGTATISSKFTTRQAWETNFFTVRTELLSNLPPAAIAALDAWYKKYTTYKVDAKGKW